MDEGSSIAMVQLETTGHYPKYVQSSLEIPFLMCEINLWADLCQLVLCQQWQVFYTFQHTSTRRVTDPVNMCKRWKRRWKIMDTSLLENIQMLEIRPQSVLKLNISSPPFSTKDCQRVSLDLKPCSLSDKVRFYRSDYWDAWKCWLRLEFLHHSTSAMKIKNVHYSPLFFFHYTVEQHGPWYETHDHIG